MIDFIICFESFKGIILNKKTVNLYKKSDFKIVQNNVSPHINIHFN